MSDTEMSEQRTKIPKFEVNESDIIGYDKLTPEGKFIAVKMLRVDKMLTWICERISEIEPKVERHERVLGPVVAMFIFAGAASGIVVALIEAVKLFK